MDLQASLLRNKSKKFAVNISEIQTFSTKHIFEEMSCIGGPHGILVYIAKSLQASTLGGTSLSLGKLNLQRNKSKLKSFKWPSWWPSGKMVYSGVMAKNPN